MGCKILVALLFVVQHHFLNRSADRESRRIEHPCAFGAARDPNAPYFSPHQFAAHGLPSKFRHSAPSWSYERPRSIGFGAHPHGDKSHLSRLPWTKLCVRTEYTSSRCYRHRMATVCGVPNKGRNLLSQSEVILELMNDAVALTGGLFEFPPVHNLHCASHVFYDSSFL
jgi:hypothetical protein